MDISMMYCWSINNLLMAIFYFPIFPYLSIIGLAGIIISYMIDKVRLKPIFIYSIIVFIVKKIQATKKLWSRSSLLIQ
jgi:hypothetical protein